MAHQRVLKVEQAEAVNTFAVAQQHDVFGVIISQLRDALPLRIDRGQDLAPGRKERLTIHIQTDGGAIPIGEEADFLQPLVQPMRLQPRWRRMAVQFDEDIDDARINGRLQTDVRIHGLAHPDRAEILNQQQPLIEVARKDSGCRKTDAGQILSHMDEGTRVLMRRWRVHQHGLTRAINNAEIAAKGGIARQRQDLRPAPACTCQKVPGPCRWCHGNGHRSFQDGGTVAVKRRGPSAGTLMWRRSASGHNQPSRSGHSISRTPSSNASSSPNSMASSGSSNR